jgi:hypothetical protein
MVRWLVIAVSVVVAGSVTTACSLFGPTTKTEVCSEFDELGDRFLHANGVVDTLIFSQAGTLADVADRYDGSPGLADDASALEKISDADTTSGLELMAATNDIASLCGHVLGANTLASGDGDFSWGGQGGGGSVDTGDETPDHRPTTTEPPSSTDESDVGEGKTVAGPGGIRVEIPAGWTVGESPAAANQQASDPSDPDVFVRFGASAPPDVPLLTEIQNGERGNPNVQNGYRRVQLTETSFLGQAAVDWEFTFVKDGVTRHAWGRYWRQNGLTYVIYLSAPDGRWSSVRWVFDVLADSATVY